MKRSLRLDRPGTRVLRCRGEPERPTFWKTQDSETDTLWGKTYGCTPGGPVSCILMGAYYSHRLTPDALAIYAADLLRCSGGNHEERRRWRQYQEAVEKKVQETPEDTLLDEAWIRAARERTIGSGL